MGTSGLAAAGVLPNAAQDMVSDVLGRVGISVPASEHPTSSGEQISEIATTTSSTGVGKGAEISSTASGGMSQAGEHGSVSDGAGMAPVPTPNGGRTGTADTASGGASDAGTDIAEEKSDGRSAAGSGNASAAPSLPPTPERPAP